MKISGLPVDLPRGFVSRDGIATQLAVLMTFGLNFVVFDAPLRTGGTVVYLPNPSFQKRKQNNSISRLTPGNTKKGEYTYNSACITDLGLSE